MYRLIFIGMVAFVFLSSGCVFMGKRVNGDGHVVKSERPIADFHALHVEGSMNVYLTQGTAQPAMIEAEDNIIPYIETDIDNGRLFIRVKNNFWIDNHEPINIYITAPAVDELHMAGSGEITTQNEITNPQQIWIGVAGSGDIKAILNTPYIRANISGSGDIDVSGEIKNMDVNITGSGNLNAQKLLSETVSAKITGSGDAYVYASQKIDADVIGSGDVYYQGEAQVNSHIIGSGEVAKKSE